MNMREIREYYGYAISDKVIQDMKNIFSKVYKEDVFNCYYGDIDTVNDLVNDSDAKVNNYVVIMGKDWVLHYEETDKYMRIVDWGAINNHNKLVQTAEMLAIFKKILLRNRDKKIMAAMRHDTTYPMYCYLVKNGYLKEIEHDVGLDGAIDNWKALKLKFKFDLSNYNNMMEALNSDNINETVDDKELDYILHNVTFVSTDKFYNKYSVKKKIK